MGFERLMTQEKGSDQPFIKCLLTMKTCSGSFCDCTSAAFCHSHYLSPYSGIALTKTSHPHRRLSIPMEPINISEARLAHCNQLAETYNGALAAPSLAPGLFRKPGTNEYLVKAEVTGQGTTYDDGLASNKPAPPLNSRWADVSDQYSSPPEAQLDFTERVSQDPVNWTQRQRAVGAYRSAINRSFGWLDYHASQIDGSARELLRFAHATSHEVSALRTAAHLVALGEEAAVLVAEKHGRALDGTGKRSPREVRDVAKGVLKLQMKALRPFGIDTRVSSSMETLAERDGDLYFSWVAATEKRYEKKLKSCLYKGTDLARGKSPYTSTMPNKPATTLNIDDMLVDALTKRMLTSPTEYERQRRTVVAANPGTVITESPSAPVISYRDTATASTFQKGKGSRDPARSAAFVAGVSKATRALDQKPQRRRHIINYPDVRRLEIRNSSQSADVSLGEPRQPTGTRVASPPTQSEWDPKPRPGETDGEAIARLAKVYTNSTDPATRAQIAALFGLDPSEVLS